MLSRRSVGLKEMKLLSNMAKYLMWFNQSYYFMTDISRGVTKQKNEIPNLEEENQYDQPLQEW